jgi:hypothetical protein
MLRLNDTIKLMDKEVDCHRLMTGCIIAPKSVQEHNLQLEQAVQTWETEATPEAKLLAAISKGMMIPV